MRSLGCETLSIGLISMLATACDSRSSAAFTTPPDGDAEHGRAALAELGGNSCHGS
jgi:hypothetical protein